MSAGNCPVCSEPKEKRWHLVCPYCWVKVPDADQAEIYDLYRKARNSTAHVMKCRKIVRDLCVLQRAKEPMIGNLPKCRHGVAKTSTCDKCRSEISPHDLPLGLPHE